MPDTAQIVPIAKVLNVTTDALFGIETSTTEYDKEIAEIVKNKAIELRDSTDSTAGAILAADYVDSECEKNPYNYDILMRYVQYVAHLSRFADFNNCFANEPEKWNAYVLKAINRGFQVIRYSNDQTLIDSVHFATAWIYIHNKEYDKAIEKANILIATSDISENQKRQANYILGKSYFDKKNYDEALKYFDICTSIDKSETGAECGYYSSVCLYNLNKYDEAEEKVFEVSDKYNAYIYWTARSFIILSDVYVAKDNAFQAKETLKSVIENYPQEGEHYNNIIRDAQNKLDFINKESNE